MKKKMNIITSFLFSFILLFSSISSLASAAPSNSSVVEESSSTLSASSFPWISSADLAAEALNATGNSGYQLGTVPAYIVTEAAKIYVGPGYTAKIELGGFWFYSKDGLRRVRTGQKISFGIYQANFEKFSQQGYNSNYQLTNYHVNVSDE